jgi:hypothetical protein
MLLNFFEKMPCEVLKPGHPLRIIWDPIHRTLDHSEMRDYYESGWNLTLQWLTDHFDL